MPLLLVLGVLSMFTCGTHFAISPKPERRSLVDWQLFSIVSMVLGTFIVILAYSEARRAHRTLPNYSQKTPDDSKSRQAA